MRLKELRQNMNVSQKAVADFIGCSPNVYSRYEIEERQPSIDTLKRLSAYFSVSIDYIVENHSEVSPSFSDYEMALVKASREADDRAREDAFSILVNHRKTTDTGA